MPADRLGFRSRRRCVRVPLSTSLLRLWRSNSRPGQRWFLASGCAETILSSHRATSGHRGRHLIMFLASWRAENHACSRYPLPHHLQLGPLPGDEWGFTGTFDRDNGGGFLTDHFPTASKAIWNFDGMFCESRHIPGVRFPGLIHPGLIGTAPSKELLDIWNKREKALCDAGSVSILERLPPRPWLSRHPDSNLHP